MDIVSFLTSWQFVVVFYAFIFLIVYRNKEKFQFQAKFIALYKTKIGIKAMQKIADNFKGLVKFLGYVGVWIGYIGMLIIVYYIAKGLFNLVFIPDAPATLAPVIPGVKIPGSPIFVPFWYGILSLFVVIVIHEFSHGVVSKAHGIPIKSSGFVLFGPIPGAFVEPDEKILKKKKPFVQNSVFAAGPFSNFLTGALVILLFMFVITPWVANSFPQEGISFEVTGEPARIAGLQPEVTYHTVNGDMVKNSAEFIEAINDIKPGDIVNIANSQGGVDIIAGEHPTVDGRGYLGVNIETRFYNESGFAFKFMIIIVQFLNWLFILSLGLGLANLLPLGPVDGGRMYQLACRKFFGAKKGDLIWVKTAGIFLVAIVILLFVPIFKALL